MEFKKAVSRESAYAKADSERNTRVASSLFTSRMDLHAVAISDGFSGDLKQKSSPVFHGANFSPEEHKTKHKVPSHSSSDSDEQDEVPKQEDVYRWPHLRGFVYLTELNSRLSGSDVPEALQRKEVIPAAGGGPYASKVEFG